MSVRVTRLRRGYRLETEQTLPGRRETVFPFFAEAANLESITPPSLSFRILTPGPITMESGRLIDYRLRLSGWPIRWRSEITAWEPPWRFVDEQRRGPYRWWRHEHEFIDDGDRTIVRDTVDYGVPGGAVIHGLLVRRQLLRIFEYRRQALAQQFASQTELEGALR